MPTPAPVSQGPLQRGVALRRPGPPGSGRAELLRLSPLNLLWTTEDPYELPVNVGRADGFDLVFTNDAGSVADYGGKAHHMPLAADVVEDPLPLEQRYRDVFFAGVAWPNRVSFLRTSDSALAGIESAVVAPLQRRSPQARPADPGM